MNHREANPFPVYEFRPLESVSHRYADGRWLEDDGSTYDLAFLSAARPPIGYAVSLPYRRSLLWSWTDRGWQTSEPRHPRGNPWHYMARNGSRLGAAWGRDSHPNTLAGRAAANENCRRFYCSNGRGPDFVIGDRYIAAGLVRERETQRVLAFPEHLVCIYCGPVTAPVGAA